MLETTTVKVTLSTRERLRHVGNRGTADEVINRALDALDREELRRGLSEQARQVAGDPRDRHEVASIMADMEYLSGGLT